MVKFGMHYQKGNKLNSSSAEPSVIPVHSQRNRNLTDLGLCKLVIIPEVSDGSAVIEHVTAFVT